MKLMRPPTTTPGYTAVAIILHWAIAVAIVGDLVIGLWMHQAIDVAATRARAVAVFQLHKSIGLTVLALTMIRLLWRLAHRPPPLPLHMAGWEKVAAHITHGALYLLMFALPLSGWLYVSTQWRGDAPLLVPTMWFGLLPIPNLFGLQALANEARAAWSATLLDSHALLAWTMVALLVLHVGAAIKHQFIDRDEVAAQMIPALAAERQAALRSGQRLVLRGGLVAIAAAVLATAWAIFRPLSPDAVPVAKASDDIVSVPGSWRIDPAQSAIKFSAANAGDPFSGRFTRWQSDIRIERADPGQSQIAVTVWTASATDGISMHDEALPTREWFHVAEFPTARYEATAIQPAADGSWSVDGRLTIKDRSASVGPLRLELAAEGRATIAGKLSLSRAQFDLGMDSDPGGEWVSRDIEVEVQAVLHHR
ncbi:MAG: cytochrome b/b6 domain-containing protein [Gammaproteobacteria bacterium]|nr:cytochrome b/b6 domain-containing protein [Gammaproteobacteria bacterium]